MSIYAQFLYHQYPEYIQANSNWVFGYGAGVSFTNGGNNNFTATLRSEEGCATVSDPETGQVLFYSNGLECYNRDGNIMQNGSELLGGTSLIPGLATTYQGVCIVPFIDDPHQY